MMCDLDTPDVKASNYVEFSDISFQEDFPNFEEEDDHVSATEDQVPDLDSTAAQDMESATVLNGVQGSQTSDDQNAVKQNPSLPSDSAPTESIIYDSNIRAVDEIAFVEDFPPYEVDASFSPITSDLEFASALNPHEPPLQLVIGDSEWPAACVDLPDCADTLADGSINSTNVPERELLSTQRTYSHQSIQASFPFPDVPLPSHTCGISSDIEPNPRKEGRIKSLIYESIETATLPTLRKAAKSSSEPPSPPSRPKLLPNSVSQMETQYMNMLLALDDIPMMYNLLASFFTWILLAGFVIFPGTFSSLQSLESNGLNIAEVRIIRVVSNLPLFIIAFICCGIGASGMGWLWWRWRNNYVWITNRIFLPGLMNSLAGVLSTIVNLYAVQHGELSASSEATVIVTSISAGICGILTVVYNFWKIKLVKKKHDQQVGKARAGKFGEGVVDLSRKKVPVSQEKDNSVMV